MKPILAVVTLLALSACEGGKDIPDYESAARCRSEGFTAGTKQYDNCLYEMQMNRLMEQQQQEFEQLQKDRHEHSLRRY